ncbi:MAG: hypothetical protein ACRCX2_15125 [Paraclostridium sp.]
MIINDLNLQSHLINLGVEFILTRHEQGKFTYHSTLENYLLNQIGALGIDYKKYCLEFNNLIKEIESYTKIYDNVNDFKKLN